MENHVPVFHAVEASSSSSSTLVAARSGGRSLPAGNSDDDAVVGDRRPMSLAGHGLARFPKISRCPMCQRASAPPRITGKRRKVTTDRLIMDWGRPFTTGRIVTSCERCNEPSSANTSESHSVI